MLHRRPLALVVHSPQLHDRGLHALGQPHADALRHCVGADVRQHERQRFGQIADVGITLLHQPERNARGLRSPLAEQGGRDGPQLPAAGEHLDRAGRILGRCRREILAQGVHLLIRAGRGVEPPVEVGEPFHSWASGSSSGSGGSSGSA